MDETEYIQTQQQLLLLSGLIKDMPLAEFISKINICETISPMINPTLYMQGADKLTIIKKIAHAAQQFQKEMVKLAESMKAGE